MIRLSPSSPLENVSNDMIKEDNGAWMVIKNKISIAAKLTEIKICQKVFEEKQNNVND